MYIILDILGCMLTFLGILLLIAAYTAIGTLIYHLGRQTPWFDDDDEILMLIATAWPISIPIAIVFGVVIGTVLGTSLLLRRATGGRL